MTSTHCYVLYSVQCSNYQTCHFPTQYATKLYCWNRSIVSVAPGGGAWGAFPLPPPPPPCQNKIGLYLYILFFILSFSASIYLSIYFACQVVSEDI